MAQLNQLLLVASILEGRRFPRRPKHQVVVEAKFDGETLSTDPINHTESPNFTTELAWELDKKALHQHKLQRTPIKLQCFAIDTILLNKEMVGYVILDLRSAQTKLKRPQWFPLLNSKYQRLKPELQIVLSLEDESLKKEHDLPQQHSTPEGRGAMIPFSFEPVLNEEKGFYQLGPDDSKSEVFVLSLAISYAVNLAKLIPSSFVVPNGQGFYFQYTLFGNKVSSEIFWDIVQPEFAPERASVRINSHMKLLRTLLHSFSGVKITLYCGGRRLGQANVSLQSLLPLEKPFISPAKIEALFPLVSAATDSNPASGTTDIPSVGVSVILKSEESFNSSPLDKQVVDNSSCESHVVQKVETLGYETQGKISVEANLNPNLAEKIDSEKSPKALGVAQKDQQPSFHHFCYSIDLRSISNLQVTSPVNCYLKYSYPFFGCPTPIVTSPPVEVRQHMEVPLPKSFCAFDFATSPTILKETLLSVPLLIEVYHRDAQAKDVLLGIARVTLGQVFSAEKLHAARGKQSTYGQILRVKVHIMAEDIKPVGELNIILGLEDLGPVSPEHLQAHVNKLERLREDTQKDESPVERREIGSRDKQRAKIESRSDDPRQMAEYQIALELEMWKQQQEELFTAQLKAKEMEKIKTLTEEWRKRDKEREILTKKKIEEYTQLEETLKKTIVDIEKREKQLTANENEMIKTREEQRREHERKMVELREASRRMKEDCEHQIELERARVQQINEQKQAIIQQLHDMEKRYQDKENEFLAFKETQMSKPEVKMEAELSLLRVEKAELQRKLECGNKSKIHYKQQWAKALKELGKVKENEQMAARTRLKQQEKELEEMKLKYLAAQEREISNTDRQELENMKNELNRLKIVERTKEESVAREERLKLKQEEGMMAAWEREEKQRKEELDSKIAKLIEERDTLLQTGVYTTEDRIISELDRQIREAIAQKT
ncbi:centrosomal protein of 120 kDa-like isoform X1 [Xenia sp. Carnegie-2017]|uniref:centrosomal protein of 120 kDa-like isoform X1 n=1 Tax=Xenia sp. Carnegie-2017 TaxID=2897299 RepID=UPI001F033E18|nr:centrosomal protein of 120 kDa-like isoform X1 [Xenia sp. Carnegie-2017]XP_046857017.1 centrosomal protein of 120 kDa-like isoform X1 [Xenia sp. Carnegie-2017]XP_046857021.1 centrosomal protein of 120 kDa-like isoform X1 [Xenia sp. Carnegie-2017]